MTSNVPPPTARLAAAFRAELGPAFVALALAWAGCAVDGGEILTPGQLHQEVAEGGPNPAPRVLTVGNRGGCGLDLAASAFTADGKPWLSVAPSAAVVAAGGSTDLVVDFEVVATALAPGNYVGTILLSGTCLTNGQPARGSPLAVAVNLRVTTVSAGLDGDGNVDVDVSPVADEWLPMAENTRYGALEFHTAIWTGYEMWIFGGLGAGGSQGSGGRYDPMADRWLAMASGPRMPSPRYGHAAVWTGTEMIVWGGLSAASNGEALATGGRLDGTWTPTSTAGAPEARWGHMAVWTGTEMIVFGGLGAWVNGNAPALGTGGRYDPSTDTWRALPTGSNAPAPRYDAEAVWTGNEMLVWGGRDDSGAFLGDGARYDPVLDRWRPIAPGGPVRVGVLQAWSGSEWILHGGFEENTQVYSTDGFAYSPSTDEWRSTADVGAQFGEVSHPVWTGGEMIVWGRFLGRRYDPRTDRWKDVSMVDAPTGRIGQSVVWTGSSMIVFGGWDGVDLSTGAIYR